MIERRVKVFLAVSSLVGAGVLAALAPAAAQGTGGGTGGAGNSNTVANLLIPIAAIAYGAYWLAAGIHYHQITIPHRVGHPYYIHPRPSAREETDTTHDSGQEEGEPKDNDGK